MQEFQNAKRPEQGRRQILEASLILPFMSAVINPLSVPSPQPQTTLEHGTVAQLTRGGCRSQHRSQTGMPPPNPSTSLALQTYHTNTPYFSTSTPLVLWSRLPRARGFLGVPRGQGRLSSTAAHLGRDGELHRALMTHRSRYLRRSREPSPRPRSITKLTRAAVNKSAAPQPAQEGRLHQGSGRRNLFH